MEGHATGAARGGAQHRQGRAQGACARRARLMPRSIASPTSVSAAWERPNTASIQSVISRCCGADMCATHSSVWRGCAGAREGACRSGRGARYCCCRRLGARGLGDPRRQVRGAPARAAHPEVLFCGLDAVGRLPLDHVCKHAPRRGARPEAGLRKAQRLAHGQRRQVRVDLVHVRAAAAAGKGAGVVAIERDAALGEHVRAVSWSARSGAARRGARRGGAPATPPGLASPPLPSGAALRPAP